MARSDAKLYEVFSDEVCLRLIERLLAESEPQTQRQLREHLGLNSSTISRRMNVLESAGVVQRRTHQGPYEILHPSQTRKLLHSGSALVTSILKRQLDDARATERSQHKDGFAGGHLRDRTKESG